jgi:hypothetical protein
MEGGRGEETNILWGSKAISFKKGIKISSHKFKSSNTQ